MSDAKKCDRCGRYYAMGSGNDIRPSLEGIRIFGVRYFSAKGVGIDSWDLCPKCAAKVWNYISEYDEPAEDSTTATIIEADSVGLVCNIFDEMNRDEQMLQVFNKSLCNSCITKGCMFQSGIVRNHCDFYKAESEE